MNQIVEITDAFKVVNTSPHTLQMNGKTVSFTRSALLNASPATIDYGLTNQGQRLYTAPKLDGTPIIAFNDAAAALDFASKRPGRKVYRIHGYAKLVLPIDTVLELRLGWDKQAVAFWKAVVDGADLTKFKTRSAPDNSIAIFGVVALLEQITRVPAVAPVAQTAQNAAYAPR